MKSPLTTLFLATVAFPAMAEVPKVVTDIPAIGSLAQQVMGNLGQVTVLLPAGASAHHYQIRPSDAQALNEADLLFWVGPQLTPWLDRAAANMAAENSVRLIDIPQTYVREFGPEGAHHHDEDHADDHEGHAGDHEGHTDDHEGHVSDHEDHADDHENHAGDHEEHADDHNDHDHADDHAASGEGAHVHEGVDPHLWLDPANGRVWLDAMAAAFAARDPDNAALYADNAARAKAAIAAEDVRIAARLAPLHDRSFVVFHDAYGYFTGHYGLKPAVAVALGDAAPPSAGRLSEIRGLLAENQVVCAFPEAQHSPALVETVIEGSEIRMGAALDPSGSAMPMGADLYQSLLGNMGDTLADCLSQDVE